MSAKWNVEEIRESAELPTEKPVLRAMRNYDSNTRATNTRVSLRLTASLEWEFDRSADNLSFFFFPFFLSSFPSDAENEIILYSGFHRSNRIL